MSTSNLEYKLTNATNDIENLKDDLYGSRSKSRKGAIQRIEEAEDEMKTLAMHNRYIIIGVAVFDLVGNFVMLLIFA